MWQFTLRIKTIVKRKTQENEIKYFINRFGKRNRDGF